MERMTAKLAREQLEQVEALMDEEKKKIINLVRKGYKLGEICRALSLSPKDIMDLESNDHEYCLRVIAARKEYETSKNAHAASLSGISK